MESPHDRQTTAARKDAPLFQMSGEERRGAAGPVRAVTDAGKIGLVDRQGRRESRRAGRQKDEGGRRRKKRRSMRKTEAAVVIGRRSGSRLVRAFALVRRGLAEYRPKSRRHAVTHQRGVRQRLQEIQGDRKQRQGKCRGAPTRFGPSATHGAQYCAAPRDCKSLRVGPPRLLGELWTGVTQSAPLLRLTAIVNLAYAR